MGYHRQGQPRALDRSGIRAEVIPLLAEELAFLERTADPFGIEHDCTGPTGHQFIATCRDIVCSVPGCGKVVWL